MATRAVLQAFERYQKERVTFVSAVAEMAKSPQVPEAAAAADATCRLSTSRQRPELLRRQRQLTRACVRACVIARACLHCRTLRRCSRRVPWRCCGRCCWTTCPGEKQVALSSVAEESACPAVVSAARAAAARTALHAAALAPPTDTRCARMRARSHAARTRLQHPAVSRAGAGAAGQLQ